MAGLEEKLGEVYVQIKADVAGLEKEIRDLKARMEKDSAKPKVDLVTILGKKKISELEAMQKKLKAKLEEKIKLDVDMASLNRTRNMLNAVTQEIEGLKRSSDRSSDGFMGMLKSGMKFAAGFMGVTAVLDIGKRVINAASEFEQLRTRLVSLYGSTEKASQVFEHFKEVAATTPFSLKGVVEAGSTMKAFGMDAEAMIKPVSDLAAYMGMDVVEAANAMGRAFSGGAGAADILRERGVLNLIKDFKKIDDITTLTLPEFRKALQETLIDPAAGIAGSTDRMSKTFAGAMSNMMDSLETLAAQIGELLLPVIQLVVAGVSHLTGALVSNQTEIEKVTASGNELKLKFEQLTSTYETLRRTTNKTDAEQKIFNETVNELTNTFPNYLKGVDLVNDKMETVKDKFAEARKELDRYVASLINAAALKGMEGSITTISADIVRLTRVKMGIQQSIDAKAAGTEDPFDKMGKIYKELDSYSQRAFLEANPYFKYRTETYSGAVNKRLPSLEEMMAAVDSGIAGGNKGIKELKEETQKVADEFKLTIVTPPSGDTSTRGKIREEITRLKEILEDVIVGSKEEKEILAQISNLESQLSSATTGSGSNSGAGKNRTSALKQELELIAELGKGLAEWHRVSMELIRAEAEEMVKSGVKKEDVLALQTKRTEDLEKRYKRLAEAAANMIPMDLGLNTYVQNDDRLIVKLDEQLSELKDRLGSITGEASESADTIKQLREEIARLEMQLSTERKKRAREKGTGTGVPPLPYPNEVSLPKAEAEDAITEVDVWNQHMQDAPRGMTDAYGTFFDVAMRGFDELRIRASENASAMELMFIDMGNMVIRKIEEIIATWAVMNLFSWITGGPGVSLASVAGFDKFAEGGSFTVPPGFSHDNYPIMVQSGERVNVTKASQVTDQERMIAMLSNKLDILTLNVIENGMQQTVQPGTQNVQVYGKFDGHQLSLATKKAERFNRRYR